MNRKRLITLSCAIALSSTMAVACASTDDDQITLGIAVENDAANVPFLIAAEQGLYEQCGIETNTVFFEGGGPMVTSLAAGEVDYGWTGTQTALSAAEEGQDVRTVAEINQTAAGWGIMVDEDSPIDSLDDLEPGVNISFTSQGTSSHWWALWAAQQAGLSEDQVTGTPLGGSLPAVRAALEQGDTDAAVVLLPWGDLLEEDGFRWVSKFDEELPELNFSTLNAGPSSLEDDETTAKLLGAYNESVRWMEENREETIEFIETNYELTPNVAESVYDQVIPDLNETGIMDIERMDYFIDTTQSVPGFVAGEISGAEMLHSVEPETCS